MSEKTSNRPPITQRKPDHHVPVYQIETEEELDDCLQKMNFDHGDTPVLVGIDATPQRFLVYGWAPGGDGWEIGVTFDDPLDNEGSYGTEDAYCGECGSPARRTMDDLKFPVVVI